WTNETSKTINLLGQEWKNIGKSYFGDVLEGFLPHWLEGGRMEMLNANIFSGTTSKIIHELKEIAPSSPGFWQTLNLSNKFTNDVEGQIVFGIANDEYSAKQNYVNGGMGIITDLKGDDVSYKERLSAGMNTYQLLMAPTELWMVAGMNVAKRGLTNRQLVQKSATLAERAIGRTGGVAGTAKHQYANKLLNRYQKIYGDRGLLPTHSFNNGVGNRGFLDVLDNTKGVIYDFKFGNAVISPAQFNKYTRNFGLPIQIIRP